MTLSHLKLKNQKGTSLIELMVVSGIMMIVMAGITQMVVGMNQQSSFVQKTLTRSNIEQMLMRIIQDPVALRVTANSGQVGNVNYNARNVPLFRCSDTGGVNDCTNTINPVGAPVEIVLLDIMGDPVSGTTNNPLRYDIHGNRCQNADAKCVFEVTTRFRADCLAGPVCNQAETISVGYLVREAQAARGLAGVVARDADRFISTPVAMLFAAPNDGFISMFSRNQTEGTGFRNTRMFQAANGNIGVGTTDPQATFDINGDIGFLINGTRFQSMRTNAGVRRRVPAGSYGGVTGLSDSCNGDQTSMYMCPAGDPYRASCFDIHGNPNGGGEYYNVTCRAGIMFAEQ